MADRQGKAQSVAIPSLLSGRMPNTERAIHGIHTSRKSPELQTRDGCTKKVSMGWSQDGWDGAKTDLARKTTDELHQAQSYTTMLWSLRCKFGLQKLSKLCGSGVPVTLQPKHVACSTNQPTNHHLTLLFTTDVAVSSPPC
jgi:hypothetical protein